MEGGGGAQRCNLRIMSMRAAVTPAKRGVHSLRARRATADSLHVRRTAGGVSRGVSAARLDEFRSAVWKYWNENGRHDLAWRKTADPYRIMVSEVMLQQTQVSRVKEKYAEFLKKFPNVRALARAPLSDVLKVWSGLGYNRRGKYVHDSAKMIVEKYKGRVPKDVEDLRELPGMGPYTSSAVRVFAFNLPDALIETNIRAVYIHHFFPKSKQVSDRSILLMATRAGADQDPRTWHWALMDYGVHIKRLHQNPTKRSVHYVMQSKFDGSLRQVRGSILKVLTNGEHGDLALAQKLPFDGSRIRQALNGLARDGLVQSEKGSWKIS
jgi:A/G-specific adenine glycosylase